MLNAIVFQNLYKFGAPILLSEPLPVSDIIVRIGITGIRGLRVLGEDAPFLQPFIGRFGFVDPEPEPLFWYSSVAA